ncbi:MAG: CoA-binding protein [Thermoleophilia bacterium]|nr:CoA-binding protein [Thermoleophilia bacterium]
MRGMTADLPDLPDPRDPAHAAEVLGRSRTVAVVGFSADPGKPSHAAPLELVRRGFDVIPVNPTASEVAGIATVARLADIDRHVDLVDVFRPSAQTPDIAQQAADIGAGALWLQLGITSEESAAIAREHGMAYVEDQCVAPIARRFDVRPPAPAPSAPTEE